MKNIIATILFSAAVTSCNGQSGKKNATHTTENKAEIQQTLIGKRLTLIYPQLTAEAEYLSENKIHWKATDNQGNTGEQTNDLTYKVIGTHQFFLNWVENDGTTISQVIDLKKNTALTYLTFNDEKGKRVSQFIEGTVQIKQTEPVIFECP